MTATDQLIARDAVICQAAFDHVRTLQARDPILSHEAPHVTEPWARPHTDASATTLSL